MRSTGTAGSFTLFWGPTGPTGAASLVGAGSFGVRAGPTAAASFAGAGSFGVRAGPTDNWIESRAVAGIESVEVETVPRHTGGPPLGELVLRIFIRLENQEEQLASYKERFEKERRKLGVHRARRRYYRHAVKSIFDMLTIRLIGASLDRFWDLLYWICGLF